MDTVSQFKALEPQLQHKLLKLAKVLKKHPGSELRVLSKSTAELLKSVLAYLATQGAQSSADDVPANAPAEVKAAANQERERLTPEINALVQAFPATDEAQTVGIKVRSHPDQNITLRLGPQGSSWSWGASRADIVLADLKTFESLLNVDVSIEMITNGEVKGDISTIMKLIQLIDKDKLS